MQQDDRFTVINIREYLRKNDDGENQFGEDDLRQIISEFSCEKNQDVEFFSEVPGNRFYQQASVRDISSV